MKDDRAYFLKRAEAQMALAQRATCEAAVRAHYYLAGLYWDHAYGDPKPATDRTGFASRA